MNIYYRKYIINFYFRKLGHPRCIRVCSDTDGCLLGWCIEHLENTYDYRLYIRSRPRKLHCRPHRTDTDTFIHIKQHEKLETILSLWRTLNWQIMSLRLENIFIKCVFLNMFCRECFKRRFFLVYTWNLSPARKFHEKYLYYREKKL